MKSFRKGDVQFLIATDVASRGIDVSNVTHISVSYTHLGIKMFSNEENAVLIITHNTKILENLKPDYVHVLVDGKIVKTGDSTLADEIEEKGYESFKETVEI